MKRFYNKWTHSWQWSPCGKCPACQQRKAQIRAHRIHEASFDGYVTLFVTLTYRNINIPYIRKDELTPNCSSINVYRDCSVRRVRSDSDYNVGYKYIRSRSILQTIDLFESRLFVDKDTIKPLKKLRGQSDSNKIGVLYYKDLQDFQKRLRINVQRWYGIVKPLYFWSCSEYGPTTLRPHFHLLISVPQESLAECTRSVIASWPYDSRIGTDQGIQVARNAKAYVSSYVNRGSDFPSLFEISPFKPKHSFSLGYGRQNPAFSLPKILGSIDRGNMSFVESRIKDGCVELANILYPKYVLNYYFPKFTGYSRLTYDQVSQFVRSPESIYQPGCDLISSFVTKDINILTGSYDYDIDKISAWIRGINLHVKRFLEDFEYVDSGVKYRGLPDNEYTRQMYADYLWRCWSAYASTLYLMQFDNIQDEVDMFELYDNWNDVIDRCHHGKRVDGSLFHILVERANLDPNSYRSNIVKSNNLSFLYHKCLKRKKVTNYAECRVRNV